VATTAKKERRRATRKSSDRSVVRIELKDGMGRSRWITADLIDRSEEGIGIELVTPLLPGSTLPIRGHFGPEGANATLQVGVKWCLEKDDGTFQAGLEFLDQV
jgi:hypothetical protein